MNKEGKLVIDYKYYYASDFSNGLALVYKDKENFEFINNNGKTILVKLIFDRDKIILSLFFACQALAFQIKSEAYF